MHTWSLSVEEQFYIVWPIILCIAWKYQFNIPRIFIIFFIVSFYLHIQFIDSYPAEVFFWPLSGVDMFESEEQNVNAWSIPKRAINLPSYHEMSAVDIDRVVKVLTDNFAVWIMSNLGRDFTRILKKYSSTRKGDDYFFNTFSLLFTRKNIPKILPGTPHAAHNTQKILKKYSPDHFNTILILFLS